jgi:hypothetical protein
MAIYSLRRNRSNVSYSGINVYGFWRKCSTQMHSLSLSCPVIKVDCRVNAWPFQLSYHLAHSVCYHWNASFRQFRSTWPLTYQSLEFEDSPLSQWRLWARHKTCAYIQMKSNRIFTETKSIGLLWTRSFFLWLWDAFRFSLENKATESKAKCLWLPLKSRCFMFHRIHWQPIQVHLC